MNKGLYVAICGKKKSGKDTLASIIEDEIKERFYTGYVHRLTFATPIKVIGERMFPWAPSKGWWFSSEYRDTVIPDAVDNDNKPLTYRQVLIDIGTQGRRYNPLQWVNVFNHRFQSEVKEYQGDHCITSDVRFHNEYNYLENKGFFLIKLTRKGNIGSSGATETSQDTISDTAFDHILANDGTLDELKQQARDLMPLIISHQHNR
jgi:hypothetical protein